MSPRLWPADRLRRSHGWLVPAALLALAPKCVLCVLAYAGVGVSLGVGGPELCGAAAPSPWLPVVSGLLAAIGTIAFARRRRPTR